MYFKERRVVVTGMGVVAPNGKNKDEYWESILHGRSGVKKISLFDVSEFQTQIGVRSAILIQRIMVLIKRNPKGWQGFHVSRLLRQKWL
jgi:3-oxoacyl-(acyl-carrier-protein) synthase